MNGCSSPGEVWIESIQDYSRDGCCLMVILDGSLGSLGYHPMVATSARPPHSPYKDDTTAKRSGGVTAIREVCIVPVALTT